MHELILELKYFIDFAELSHGKKRKYINLAFCY